MRILICDDEYVARAKLQAILTDYGECQTASDGVQAVQMFKEAHEQSQPYNLITMDIDMPGMKGPDVLDAVREWESKHGVKARGEAKVIMVTIKEEGRDILSSFEKGCEWYLVKPVTPGKIKEAIEGLDFSSGDEDEEETEEET